MGRWLELERAVLDIEVPDQAGLQLVQNLRCVAVVEALIAQGDVG
jgi:hypothetical protein